MTEIRALEIGLIRWGKWAVWLRSEVRALGPCIGVMLVSDEVGTTAGPADWWLRAAANVSCRASTCAYTRNVYSLNFSSKLPNLPYACPKLRPNSLMF